MIQITIIDGKTAIKIDDVEIFISGEFEIKKSKKTNNSFSLDGQIISKAIQPSKDTNMDNHD